MRWPWRRRCSEPSDDARHAVQQAQRQMRDTDRMSARADEVVETLHEIRRRNHFGESVAQAYRGA